MDLRRLEYFLAVVDCGNVTRAAELCFVTQSALSAQLKRLESEVGSSLFVRGPRGVHLTHAGQTLRPLARRIVAEVAVAEGTMAALNGLLRGRLHLGVIQGLPPELDPVALVGTFHRRHPEVELQVRTGASLDLAGEVLEGALDLALVGLPTTNLPAGLVRRPLVEDPLVAVVPPGAVPDPRGAIGLDRLVELGDFVHYRRRSGLRLSVDAAIDRAGTGVEAPFELDQISDMVRFVEHGLGVTVVPRSSAPPARVPGGTQVPDVLVLPLSDRAAVHPVGVVHLRQPAPATEAFVDLMTRASAVET